MPSLSAPNAGALRHAIILWQRVAMVLILFVSSVRADSYDDMRVNWFNNLTGGTAYDSTDPNVVTATTSLTTAPTLTGPRSRPPSHSPPRPSATSPSG